MALATINPAEIKERAKRLESYSNNLYKNAIEVQKIMKQFEELIPSTIGQEFIRTYERELFILEKFQKDLNCYTEYLNNYADNVFYELKHLDHLLTSLDFFPSENN